MPEQAIDQAPRRIPAMEPTTSTSKLAGPYKKQEGHEIPGNTASEIKFDVDQQASRVYSPGLIMANKAKLRKNDKNTLDNQ